MNDAKELLQEGRELAAAYGAAILRLDEDVREGRPTGASCAEAFRAVHTLKSIAAFAQMPHLARVAEVTESALGQVRGGHTTLDDALFGLLLAAETLLTVGIAGDSRAEDGERIAAWTDAVRWLVESRPTSHAAAMQVDANVSADVRALLSANETEDLRSAMAKGGTAFMWTHVYSILDLEAELEQARTRAAPHAAWVALLPAEGDTEAPEIRLSALLVSALKSAALAGVLQCSESELRIASGLASQPSATAPKTERQSASWRSAPAPEPASPTVRVHIEELDTMLAELAVLARSGANKAARTRHIAALRESLVSARSVELSQLYERLARATRQASLELGKPVRLSTSGGELQLDKRLSDSVFEPLLHIVRNALAHGIEDKATRAARGKDETGRLVLTAFAQAGGLAIEVEDDGAGVNMQLLRARAAESGHVTPHVARTASDEECLSWAFLPGLSTREGVTPMSGRGVGLDAVSTAVRSVGGQVELRSVSGVGTKLTLYLPRHASVIRVVKLQSVQFQVDVPLAHVRSARALDNYSERVVAGERLLSLHDERFFARSLRRVLGAGRDDAAPRENLVLHMHSPPRSGGLLVEGPLHTDEVMLYPFGSDFEELQGYIGVAEHADGTLALVLNHHAPTVEPRDSAATSAPFQSVAAPREPHIELQRGSTSMWISSSDVRVVTPATAWLRIPKSVAPRSGLTLERGQIFPVLDAWSLGNVQSVEMPPAPGYLVHLAGDLDGIVLACDHVNLVQRHKGEAAQTVHSATAWARAHQTTAAQ